MSVSCIADSTSIANQPSDINHMRKLSLENWTIVLFTIIVLGMMIGALSASLTLLLELVQHVMQGAQESVSNPSGAGVPWRRAISIIAASIIAAIVWYFLRRKTYVPSVSKAVKGEKMPFFATILHVLLQIFIVGAGMSIGRETAPRELGSMLGQRISAWLRLSARDITVITAVCAGAGFAGVYDAPLAGMFFAVEMLLADVSLRTVMLALGTSAVAAFTGELVKGHKAFYSIPKIELSWQLIVVCCIVGPLMGLIAYYFRKGTTWASKRQTHSVHIVWQLPLVGVLTALVAYFTPTIMGNGRALAQWSYNSNTSTNFIILLLFVFALLKTFITIMTVRSGASGGVLTPAIATGAAVGAIVAIVFLPIFPQLHIGVIALIASAAFLATSQKAPLMASCLMIELSHSSIDSMMVIGIAVGLSVLVSSTLDKYTDK
ncbi:chloride channel protein [Alloscardovia venturai]|uniref:Chloride channel protein n=1 Tax=Alloscardovia venturai TaxID=1769421 RepID=A0ABW2Y3U2_9BIFI